MAFVRTSMTELPEYVFKVLDQKPGLLGYHENGRQLFIEAEAKTFEEYLLHRTRIWQRFMAKYISSSVNLGFFHKVGHAGYMNWYLFWCGRCRKFQVNYRQGLDRGLNCRLCQSA